MFPERVLPRAESSVLFAATKTLSCYFTNSFDVIKTILQLNIPPGNLRYGGVRGAYKAETRPALHPESSSTERTYVVLYNASALERDIQEHYANRFTRV